MLEEVQDAEDSKTNRFPLFFREYRSSCSLYELHLAPTIPQPPVTLACLVPNNAPLWRTAPATFFLTRRRLLGATAGWYFLCPQPPAAYTVITDCFPSASLRAGALVSVRWWREWKRRGSRVCSHGDLEIKCHNPLWSPPLPPPSQRSPIPVYLVFKVKLHTFARALFSSLFPD